MIFKKDNDINLENIRNILSKNSDIIFREIYINGNSKLHLSLIFVDGLVEYKLINDNILKPLAQEKRFEGIKSESDVVTLIEQGTVYFSNFKKSNDIKETINSILSGNACLIFSKLNIALIFDTKGFETRSITEPTAENVIKGAKDSFVENLRTNTATIRKKITSPNLIIEQTTVGKLTNTQIAVVYVQGIANDKIIEEIKKRLNNINIDGVIIPGIIEEYIVDSNYSPFPQIIATERADKFCSNILEGRVGLIIDGIPVTYIIPATLNQFLQAPEDYSQNYLVSSLVRFIRYVLMIIALLLPGFYVAITTFHQEMIPTKLAVSIQESKQGVPFPAFIEVIFMLIAFEVLQEAGLRLPKNIGQAVSIVGALVVGEAAVSAKLVSPAVVVIIAGTVISGFAMPNQDFSNAIRICRFIMVILSSILGLMGLAIGIIFLLHHLAKIETYGVPYLSPFAGSEKFDVDDTLFRFPFKLNKKRPQELNVKNNKRYK